ncbi:MAG: hypothetical protein ACI83I_001881 [Bacteroidia bacterium]
MKRQPKVLRTIGIIECIDLREAKIFTLPCKIDTGADSSSIHCERIRIKEIEGVDHLVFKLLDKSHERYTGKDIVTSEFKEKKVTSSFGDYQYRFQVKLKVTVFNQTFNVAFNLSDRKNMRFPVLLGRRFLRNRFVVDVSKKYLNTTNHKNIS